MGTLYVVATPIGNLSDLSERAVDTLKQSSFIVAEDTRKARALLSYLGQKKDIIRIDEHSDPDRVREICEKIRSDTVAYVTDAGTANVSDPGWQLISIATETGMQVVPIPGASALTAAISVSHFPVHPFVFWGFPPHKKGRIAFFKKILDEERAQILYESPHRIEKTLDELSNLMPEREMLIGKELTKMHERFFRGKAEKVLEEFKLLSEVERKGEYVIVIAHKKHGAEK